MTDTTPSKHTLLLRVMCACWLISKLSCYKLWLADRFFSTAPVHNIFSWIPVPVFLGLFIFSCILMLAIIIWPSKKMLGLLLFLEILVCLADQNRWQIWEYQFIFMSGCFLFIRDEQRQRNALRIVVAALYFFSGLHKFSSGFIFEVWNNTILTRWLGISGAGITLLRAGYLVSVIEMMMGLFLLFNVFPKVNVIAIALMHLLLLLMLGPLGLHMNSSIWAWNVFMPLIVYLLFWKRSFSFSWQQRQPAFTVLVIVCWWILPWLMLAGKWDRYLSFPMYSGGQEHLYVCPGNKPVPWRLNKYLQYGGAIPCKLVVSFSKWGIGEMNVMPYPEHRIYRELAADYKRNFGDSSTKFYLYKSGFHPTVTEFVP